MSDIQLSSATQEDLLNFVERYMQIENEKKLLSEDMKDLFEEAKEKVDIKSLKCAIRVAKIRSKLAEDEQDQMDQILSVVDGHVQ